MNFTSIEQSKKLLELGIKPETADMEYKCVGFTMHTNRPTDDFRYKLMLKECDIPHEAKYDVPCWSAAALIDLMPFAIQKDGEEYELHIGKDETWYYRISYFRISEYGMYIPEMTEWGNSDENFIDVCFQMIMTLVDNGYIKN